MKKVDVEAGIKLAAHDCTAQGNQAAANELLDILAVVRELIASTKRIVRFADSEPDGGHVVEVSRANIERIRAALGHVA